MLQIDKPQSENFGVLFYYWRLKLVGILAKLLSF